VSSARSVTTSAPGEARTILFLIPSLELGGAERQLVGLASTMRRHGWYVVVVTMYGGGPLERDLRERGIVPHSLRKRSRWDLPVVAARLVRILRRERFDIVHGYLSTPNLLVTLLAPLAGRPAVVWGIRASDMDLRRYGRAAAISFHLGARLARFADLVICNSTAGLEHHAAHGYPRRRMVVVPNGIDGERFRPDPDARAAVRTEWDVAGAAPVVGIVGRLDPMKDHATFLRAAALVASERPDVTFVCVGDGPAAYRATLETMAGGLGLGGRIRWVGARHDMPRVYNALDLKVSASAWGEGFPNVVAEAMASGVPCVVTDAGDSAMVVGETGWVCRAGDAAGIAEAIRTALSSGDMLRAHGAHARERILREFTEERLAVTTMDHLRRTLLRRGARPGG